MPCLGAGMDLPPLPSPLPPDPPHAPCLSLPLLSPTQSFTQELRWGLRDVLEEGAGVVATALDVHDYVESNLGLSALESNITVGSAWPRSRHPYILPRGGSWGGFVPGSLTRPPPSLPSALRPPSRPTTTRWATSSPA